ncbi:MAG: hypothetical protein CL470_06830 [Acidimicrobiaceae bacterium]|nr:hypothetical protein [Acidimicrobiaceae bacterium]
MIKNLLCIVKMPRLSTMSNLIFILIEVKRERDENRRNKVGKNKLKWKRLRLRWNELINNL